MTRTRADWMAGLEEVGVPCSPVNDVPELSQTEQLQAADLLRNLPGTALNVVGLPIVFDGERPHPRSDAPKLGQHNDEVAALSRATAAE
jgi:crotonobetainyl-CoA:carnitine CoA-transferase CaiB-like acyl-CoA transferase